DYPVQMNADSRRLRQVMYNLLNNAVMYTADGGAIEFEGYAQEVSDGRTLFIVSVADTGIGILDEDLERVFQPFEQLKTAPAAHQDGNGLGLALVRTYLELHNGTIHAESNGLGYGSRFVVKLPLSSL
ncbi:MAG: hypothetical protein HN368_21400, partial [Spirochaetales bacterium]|nr:hypothetical protein [Spirochaetales bacterium]